MSLKLRNTAAAAFAAVVSAALAISASIGPAINNASSMVI